MESQIFYNIAIGFFTILFIPQYYTIYKSKCSSDISLLFVFLWILGDTLAIITSILINNYFLSYISLSHTVLDFILLLFVTFYRQINVEEYLPIINTISSDDVRFSGNFGRRRLSKFNYFYYSIMFTGLYYIVITFPSYMYIPENIMLGQILGTITTVAFFVTRIPQIIKNYKNDNIKNLSINMFILTICGNIFQIIGISCDCIPEGNCNNYMPILVGMFSSIFIDSVIILQILFSKLTNI